MYRFTGSDSDFSTDRDTDTDNSDGSVLYVLRKNVIGTERYCLNVGEIV